MIYILHGDDIQNSRKKLNEFLAQWEWIVKIDGQNSPVKDLSIALESQELFSSKKLILIENILKFAKQDIETVIYSITKYIKSPEVLILVWNEGEFDKKFLQKNKFGTVLSFPLPKFFYSFLDSFTPNNVNRLYGLLEKLSSSTDPEQIFYALIKRLRSLLTLKGGNWQEFKETKNMGDWQLSKLQKQAQLWPEPELVNVYKKLFDLELRMKTSMLPLSLEDHLGLLILGL